ncbi:MAG: hypothetical protein SF053_15905 [Bacteroidia bacterium]|nr:hypothetical protein [Bacteroidia bacterium]
MPYTSYISSRLASQHTLAFGLCGWMLCISLCTVPAIIPPEGRICFRSGDHPHPVSLMLNKATQAPAELEGECDAEGKEDVSLKKIQDYLPPTVFRPLIPDPDQVYYLHEIALISRYVADTLLMPPEA